MHNNVTETSAKIYEVNSRARVVLVSAVNQEMIKFDATKSGQRRNRQISTYHQWRYSFKNKKKYQTNRITVTRTVKIPITIVPHLIGKQPQQDDSTVNSLEQTHWQQQHGSLIGAAYGSSSSSS